MNTAGQAAQWANAVRTYTTARAESWCSERVMQSRKYVFPTDLILDETYLRGRRKILGTHLKLARQASHVVLESGRSIAVQGPQWFTLAASILLRGVGVRSALLFHGSDIRGPKGNAAARSDSPFREQHADLTGRLELQTAKMRRWLQWWPFKVFVSTVDLKQELPNAVWVPVVPAPEWFTPIAPISDRVGTPRVLHLPSSPELSNSQAIETVCTLLHGLGMIEFRMLTGISPSEVRKHVEWADVVIDKIGLGVYGVMAVQVMASGRLLIGDVDQIVRDELPDLPLIQSSIRTLEQVIRDLVADRSTWDARAAAGQAFARKYHDGRYSAEVLARWMGVSVNQP
jgi:hypothetical protein